MVSMHFLVYRNLLNYFEMHDLEIICLMLNGEYIKLI